MVEFCSYARQSNVFLWDMITKTLLESERERSDRLTVQLELTEMVR
jgi:hypothetical protein